eukprot:TRINITY_DN30093_c0_g1_i1.p1 TRINITY_DN30093_c0_g1~~TRINITY_DN30093_c0_g1_i1.p1  ORF type:complete len:352 (+),score=69.10 TRINITY_DN30093_c0_g1_i1:39-1094(+)
MTASDDETTPLPAVLGDEDTDRDSRAQPSQSPENAPVLYELDEVDTSPSAAASPGPSQWHTPRQTPRSHSDDALPGANQVATAIPPGSPTQASDAVPPSPSHGVFLSQPASIDEPLLLLDEDEIQERHEAERAALNEELAEARRSGKVDRAAVEALKMDLEELKQEKTKMRRDQQRLEQENNMLRQQLDNHMGIMADEWAQTLGFQERLRQEEAEAERLTAEVDELRAALALRIDENASLLNDATLWRLLVRTTSHDQVTVEMLDHVLEMVVPAVASMQTESRTRARAARSQLRDELEQQLCAVCRDAKKAVLFLPCQHLCVCENCRTKLRPYRCPMCQEPVQSHIGRVHF